VRLVGIFTFHTSLPCRGLRYEAVIASRWGLRHFITVDTESLRFHFRIEFQLRIAELSRHWLYFHSALPVFQQVGRIFSSFLLFEPAEGQPVASSLLIIIFFFLLIAFFHISFSSIFISLLFVSRQKRAAFSYFSHFISPACFLLRLQFLPQRRRAIRRRYSRASLYVAFRWIELFRPWRYAFFHWAFNSLAFIAFDYYAISRFSCISTNRYRLYFRATAWGFFWIEYHFITFSISLTFSGCFLHSRFFRQPFQIAFILHWGFHISIFSADIAYLLNISLAFFYIEMLTRRNSLDRHTDTQFLFFLFIAIIEYTLYFFIEYIYWYIFIPDAGSADSAAVICCFASLLYGWFSRLHSHHHTGLWSPGTHSTEHQPLPWHSTSIL